MSPFANEQNTGEKNNIPHYSDSSKIYNRTIVDRVSKTKNIPHYSDSSKIYNRTIIDTVSTTNKQILI
jgi:hypothetical protein